MKSNCLINSRGETIGLREPIERSVSLYTVINLPNLTNVSLSVNDLQEAVWHFYTCVSNMSILPDLTDIQIRQSIELSILDYYDEIRVEVSPHRISHLLEIISAVFPNFRVPCYPKVENGWVSCGDSNHGRIEIDIIEVKVISSGLMVIFYGYPDRVPSVDKGENTVWGNWSIDTFNVADMYPKNLTIANMSVESFKTGRVKKEHSIADVMKGWTGREASTDSNKPPIIKPTRIV